MLVQKLSLDSFIPKKSTNFSAGYDLYSPSNGCINPNQRLLIPLNISIKLPKNCFGHILPRSGLALKNGIHVGAGIIDEDYRGNVGVLLFNLGENPFEFNKGDRIAQIVIKKYENVNVYEVESLDETIRGNGGFGSSGK